MQPATLNCPNCGGTIAKDSTQCQYCHALLRTVACPHCMGMLFAGCKYCPHCGVAVEAVVQGEATQRKCPRCHVALERVMAANTPMEECLHCGGLWVDVASFDTIVSTAEAQTAATGLKLPPPVEVQTHVLYLNCPQCGKLMNRLNYAGHSGVILSVCRAHGMWLDRDEMRQIVEFIRAGGLDHSRQMETEKLAQERRWAEISNSGGGSVNWGTCGSIGHGDNAEIAVSLVAGIAAVVGHLLR